MAKERPIILATRGSALALAQAHYILEQCRAAFPRLAFEIKIIKTTGDKLQSASLVNPKSTLPKGLFTKELEVALVKGQADLAVHSLKDLPVDLPPGLALGAVAKRADPRDVLIYRDAKWLAAQASRGQVDEWAPGHGERRGCKPGTGLGELPQGYTLATSSARRQAQVRARRPDLRLVELRGNVVTRLEKLANRAELDAILLAAAGLERLHFRIDGEGRLVGDAVPDGLLAVKLEVHEMVPCPGQAAIGIEVRAGDERVQAICQRLNHYNTWQAVTAERAFLKAMGGGCHSAVAAHAEVQGNHLHMQAVAEVGGKMQRVEARHALNEPEALGRLLAAELSGK
ncbi:MAG: hydroxymethylbilane synthase [Verrucomicrobiae bacterium]|nr:hydroxymethylbilane synthase [Verrucomicrobiae bacterium]